MRDLTSPRGGGQEVRRDVWVWGGSLGESLPPHWGCWRGGEGRVGWPCSWNYQPPIWNIFLSFTFSLDRFSWQWGLMTVASIYIWEMLLCYPLLIGCYYLKPQPIIIFHFLPSLNQQNSNDQLQGQRSPEMLFDNLVKTFSLLLCYVQTPSTSHTSHSPSSPSCHLGFKTENAIWQCWHSAVSQCGVVGFNNKILKRDKETS